MLPFSNPVREGICRELHGARSRRLTRRLAQSILDDHAAVLADLGLPFDELPNPRRKTLTSSPIRKDLS